MVGRWAVCARLRVPARRAECCAIATVAGMIAVTDSAAAARARTRAGPGFRPVEPAVAAAPRACSSRRCALRRTRCSGAARGVAAAVPSATHSYRRPGPPCCACCGRRCATGPPAWWPTIEHSARIGDSRRGRHRTGDRLAGRCRRPCSPRARPAPRRRTAHRHPHAGSERRALPACDPRRDDHVRDADRRRLRRRVGDARRCRTRRRVSRGWRAR